MEQTFTVVPSDLKDAITWTLAATAKDNDTRDALKCVQLELSGKELTVTACNGYSLHYKTIALVGAQEYEPLSVLLTGKNAKVLASLLPKQSYAVSLTVNEASLTVNAGGSVPLEKDLTFPNWRQIVPTFNGEETKVMFHADFLRNALHGKEFITITLNQRQHAPCTVTYPVDDGRVAVIMPAIAPRH